MSVGYSLELRPVEDWSIGASQEPHSKDYLQHATAMDKLAPWSEALQGRGLASAEPYSGLHTTH